MKDARTVLMVAFHYPPAGGSSGVLRTLKFTRYLSRHGWRPVVLTVAEKVHDKKDATLMAEIPRDVPVYRCRAFDAKRHFSIRGRYIDLMATPDPHASWLPFGILKGLEAIREEKVDLLFSTCPLPTAHLIGLALKKIGGLPWVADFRDPWIEEEPESGRKGFRYGLERRLERRVLESADAVVATTEALKKDLIRMFRAGEEGKYHVVMNGYDEENFLEPDVPAGRKVGPMEIIHAGLVNDSYRDPKPFLSAVAKTAGDLGLGPGEIHVTFLGGGEYLSSGPFRRFLGEHRLERFVEVAGQVPYRDCIGRLYASDLLLLFQGGADTNTLLPAKAFEYLRVGKPILALTPSASVTADLVREFGAGIVCEAGDAERIREALTLFYRKFKDDRLSVLIDRDRLEGYSRGRQAEKLAGIMDAVADRRGKSSAAPKYR